MHYLFAVVGGPALTIADGVRMQVHSLEAKKKKRRRNFKIEESEEEKGEEFAEFLKSIRDDDIFGIGKEQWEGLLEALAQDVREQADVPNHLQNAILAYRFDFILNKIREELATERTWPGEWNMHVVAPTVPIPEGHENICLAFLDLPLEALETIDQFRCTNIPEEIAVLLEQKGLLKYGTPQDVTVYLDMTGIAQVREISNKLGAGKARSRHDLINKILATASHEQVAEIIIGLTGFKGNWIKEIKEPLANLGEEWSDYIRLGGILLRNFLQAKFDSVQLQKLAQKNKEQFFVQLDYECPSLCKIRADNFTMEKSLAVNNLPPWLPGCGCSLDRKVLSLTNEEQPPLIGSMVKIEKVDDWDILKPYNLTGNAVKSKNRKYLLFWKNGMEFENKFEPGYYIVAEEGVIKVLGKIDRPSDGKISNHGTFIISDFRTCKQIGSVIWVMNIQNKVIYRHLYTKNIDLVAISENGKYAACSILGDCSIQVFDLEVKRLISEFSPQFNYSNMKINESSQSICIIGDNGDKVEFTLAGKLVDEEAYHKAWIENASAYQLISNVANSLLNDDKVDYQNLEKLLQKALIKKGKSKYDKTDAYRLLGEIAEAQGNAAEAANMYTAALQYAPKVPIRNKLKALKESIGNGLDSDL